MPLMPFPMNPRASLHPASSSTPSGRLLTAELQVSLPAQLLQHLPLWPACCSVEVQAVRHLAGTPVLSLGATSSWDAYGGSQKEQVSLEGSESQVCIAQPSGWDVVGMCELI